MPPDPDREAELELRKMYGRPASFWSRTQPASRGLERCFITTAERSDGAGAQIQGQLSVMLFAQCWNLRYIHRPLSEIDHLDPHFDGDLAAAWERFGNVGDGEMQLKEIEEQDLDRIPLEPDEMPATHWRANTLYEVEHCHVFADSFPDKYDGLLPTIRQRYHRTCKPDARYFSPDKVSVAVHVRRGDIVGTSGEVLEPERYTRNEDVFRTFCCVLEALEGLGLERDCHLFSEGDAAGFGEFTDCGAGLHLDTSTFECFHHLVSADVLLTARSSFSYLAALLNKGLKIYEPFWHQPLRSWVVADVRDPGFDYGRFTDLVTRRLESHFQ